MYEQYVIGMLTNFPSLPLDRIHNMLKMFVSEPPYDRTSEQLAAFLAQSSPRTRWWRRNVQAEDVVVRRSDIRTSFRASFGVVERSVVPSVVLRLP